MSRRIRLVLLAVAVFLVVDRASLLAVPEAYRAFPEHRRYHTLYFSQKMEAFSAICPDVETVFVGDSRTRHGVDPAFFEGSAYNLAPASGGVAFAADLIERVTACPKCKTVVWGVSPRIFNSAWSDPAFALYRASGGRQHVDDRDARPHRFALDVALGWLSVVFRFRSLLRARMLGELQDEPPMSLAKNGFMPLPEMPESDAAIAGALSAVEGGRFRFDEARWRAFLDILAGLARRDLRLVAFIPPMHPSLARSTAADADGTPDADYEALVERLSSLEDAHFDFVDLHQGGRHGIAATEFGDLDHLKPGGAAVLSRRLAQFVSSKSRGRLARPNASSAVRPPAPTAGASSQWVSFLGAGVDYAIAAYPPDNRPEIWVELAEGAGIDPRTVRLYMDGAPLAARWRGRRLSYTPGTTLEAPRLYKFRAVGEDHDGQTVELAWQLLLKPC